MRVEVEKQTQDQDIDTNTDVGLYDQSDHTKRTQLRDDLSGRIQSSS